MQCTATSELPHSQGSPDIMEMEANQGSCGTPSEPTQPSTSAVLLVGKCVRRETGNATTLFRFGHAVISGGWEAVTRDPDNIPHTEALRALIKQHNIVTVLGLHAYRSSQVLLSCKELGVPYVTVFGGTDVNKCVEDVVKREVMGRVVAGSKSLIAFHDLMRNAVLHVWPSLSPDKIWIMQQAVEVNPDLDFDVLSYLDAIESAYVDQRSHSSDQDTSIPFVKTHDAEKFVHLAAKDERMSSAGHHTPTYRVSLTENVPPPEDNRMTTQNGNLNSLINRIPCKPEMERFSRAVELPTLFQPVVLLVAGLRPVKDVLYLTEEWSKWQRARGGQGRFLIMGPSLDSQYAAHVHSQVNRLSGVRVCQSLPPRQCQAIMRNATVLVNSSHSECMSNSILEAMALGTPVIAKDIPGNKAVIEHGHTGLLYSCPQAFIRELEGLLQHVGLRDRLVTAAKERVTRCHSLEQEKELLLKILEKAIQ